jgi:hypothetical protein
VTLNPRPIKASPPAGLVQNDPIGKIGAATFSIKIKTDSVPQVT